jgi:hypothetical protein
VVPSENAVPVTDEARAQQGLPKEPGTKQDRKQDQKPGLRQRLASPWFK